MRRFAITTIALLGLAASAARAQTPAQAPAGAPTQSQPGTQAPPAPATPSQPPAPPATPADADESRSLFLPTSHEFVLGGRFTSIDGDPARFQRYQDERSGLLFTNFRYAL